MRVIAGEFRSRHLKTLQGLDVRPTPDRLRESLFNILAPRIENTVFLDAYAGIGSVGIEALSRGASRAIFIERSRAGAAIIRENLRALGIEHRAEVINGRAAQYLPHRRADIVFIDPPYAMEKEYRTSFEVLGQTGPPLVVVQHDAHFDLDSTYGNLVRYRIVKQGENRLSLYHPSSVEIVPSVSAT